MLTKNSLILVLAGTVVFLGGMQFNTLYSQGVGGRRAPVVPRKQEIPRATTPTQQRGGGSRYAAAAAGDLIAVTGDYGLGTSVLYLIDARTKQLSVYEARGGSKSQRRLVWVGARRIDLDLMTQSYNDESEVSFDRLKGIFKKQGLLPGSSGKAGKKTGSKGAGKH